MPKVLLIDDDVELTKILSQYLSNEGFDVLAIHDGEEAISRSANERFEIVVLDIMMPRLSGLQVLQRIRINSSVPILMLTARGDDVDKVTGLNLGADDYVSKPCTPAELVARIRAILRRTLPAPPQSTNGTNVQPPSRQIKSGNLVLYPASRHAVWQDQPLELTGTEFTLLSVLARHSGELVSRQEISLAAFNRPLTNFDRRIDVHISAIRQKLGRRPDGQPWIQGVRGLGYQLVED
ncbi:Two-component response regulator transcription regulator protein [Pseudomonas amygdali pv. mori]|uniref:Two-component response regulator transcription regulator protein n=2 Tax=Pseudomonas amygdali pv. mori TaxID=34065 RepID=A0A0P9VIM8_PSEA0|nr:response regulator transcription factor [Pseudomonas amygdali]EGH24714.1 two-component response regulator transcription regulator protein [Pseudomonas amygdali pv. mori str. 301020]KPY04213.1 Two-component response regulator transcription regulator protein [Pseudomonas amygdali pv. mori]QXW42885.1 response regulator transcription factor [Pseudomonas amygdali]RMQ31716.1 Two-component response regulator transcription regulator protein [Pseudomonas amygdali pv. mori]RMR49837.1 Two-component re